MSSLALPSPSAALPLSPPAVLAICPRGVPIRISCLPRGAPLPAPPPQLCQRDSHLPAAHQEVSGRGGAGAAVHPRATSDHCLKPLAWIQSLPQATPDSLAEYPKEYLTIVGDFFFSKAWEVSWYLSHVIDAGRMAAIQFSLMEEGWHGTASVPALSSHATLRS